MLYIVAYLFLFRYHCHGIPEESVYINAEKYSFESGLHGSTSFLNGLKVNDYILRQKIENEAEIELIAEYINAAPV